MQPYYYVMIGVAVAIAGAVLMTFRHEIRFRWSFGMWSRERGASRIVISVLQTQIAAIENASDAAMRAKEEFDTCPTLIAPLQAKGNSLKQAERRKRAARRRFKKLCALATELHFYSDVAIVKDCHKREIAELRLAV